MRSNCLLPRRDMKRQNRIFYRGILNHCYQRTLNGEVLFYSVSDYLAFFTIVCTQARAHKVRLLALAPMPDHIHMSVIAQKKIEFESFMRDFTRIFSKENNKTCHRTGELFQSPFGSVPKNGDKAARTNLIYLANNPQERQLCKYPEQYRWSFLSYAKSKNPFSKPLIIRNSSWALKKAVRIVKSELKQSRPLNHTILKNLFSTLTKTESEQLADFIIDSYNVIDYQSAISFFDSYEEMITAIHSSSGSEHNLNEIFIGKSDEHYAKMSAILIKELKLKDIHDIFLMDEKKRWEVLFPILRNKTEAPGEQIAKFLRINIARKM